LTQTGNSGWLDCSLASFAELTGPGPTKQIVLVMDQASWHTSPKLAGPEGIHLMHLPSHTPKLQPTERVWPYMREAVANDTPRDRAELHQRLERRWCWVADNPELIQAATHFHWWPEGWCTPF
jgi:transposase